MRSFSKWVAGSTFLLLLAGGMVTSTGSGLAVPDWPLSFGRWMPEMKGGVLYEHGHRMIAGVVGALILIQAVWLWRTESRTWVRGLATGAAVAVVVQGVLGGLTVLYRLPDPISVGHAILAEIVFGLVVAVAVARSRGWARVAEEPRIVDAGSPALATLAWLTAALTLGQIALGAVVRHTGAGLAIPDFPLAYGQLVPPLESFPVAIHFAHRLGAIVVALAVATCVVRARRSHRDDPYLARPASALAILVVVQIALGGWTVLSHKTAGVATAHLGGGALLWASCVVLALRAGHRLEPAPPVVHAPIDPIVESGLR